MTVECLLPAGNQVAMIGKAEILGCVWVAALVAVGCGVGGAEERIGTERQALSAPGALSGGGGTGGAPGAGSGGTAGQVGSAGSSGVGGTGGSSGVGGTGGSSGAGGGGDPPAIAIEIECGTTRVVQQGEKNKLYASAFGVTEEIAKAKCVQAPWANRTDYRCAAASACGDLPEPDCDMYFGPDVVETKPCECTQQPDRWLCIKEGEIPVGSSIACTGCYQAHLEVPCGQKMKLPEKVSGALFVVATETGEQAAKTACEKGAWGGESILCDPGPGGYPSRPKFTAAFATPCVCEKLYINSNLWQCTRKAVMAADSDIDCTACAPAP